ncbi:MAG TPA: hypothetical protein VFO35_20480 [Steroidobacteraceae bacterium]|nr:hypothetical protein [Steroidobacteraceae bacterium]
MRYASFFAVWLLSSLILGVVHGAGLGIFLGLAIATGYLAALRGPVLLAKWRASLQREHQHGHNSPEPHT